MPRNGKHTYARATIVPDRDVPTKTIAGPDGRPIHYPNLPNVGEPYRKPDPSTHNVSAQQSAPTPMQAAATPIASESWRERVMSAARSAVERVGVYGQAAVNALVLDDWKALTNPQSTPLQRLESGADLASWAIPEGKVAEIAGHAVVKASEIAAAHLAASGFEHAGVAAAAIAASRGLSRPLFRRRSEAGIFKALKTLRISWDRRPSTAPPRAIGIISSRRRTLTTPVSFPPSVCIASKIWCRYAR